jgi:hypothetical protein
MKLWSENFRTTNNPIIREPKLKLQPLRSKTRSKNWKKSMLRQRRMFIKAWASKQLIIKPLFRLKKSLKGEIPPNLDIHVHPSELDFIRNLIIEMELKQISESVVKITHDSTMTPRSDLKDICSANRPSLWRDKIDRLEKGKTSFSP